MTVSPSSNDLYLVIARALRDRIADLGIRSAVLCKPWAIVIDFSPADPLVSIRDDCVIFWTELMEQSAVFEYADPTFPDNFLAVVARTFGRE